MNAREKNYLLAVLFHAFLGVLVFNFMLFSKIYAILIVLFGLYYIVKNQNRNHEVLLVCGYIMGIEVFLRMTQGNLLYEYGKYTIMFFIVIGMLYKGFSKNAVPYALFALLMIPGLVIALNNLNFDDALRKSIAFNISGPFCLALAATYTYRRKITFEMLNKVLLCIGLPIISCAFYLFSYSPDIQSVVTGTASNYEASGGFGPNQVSTMLGLGMFVFLSRLLFESKTAFYMIINMTVALLIGYRGLVTFSRGGMVTAVLMMAALVFFTYLKIGSKARLKVNVLFIFLSVAVFMVWSYSSMETGGMIEKRYANQDASGRVKATQLSGREDIMASEIEYFMENPLFGIGVAMGAKKRGEEGTVVLTHNEVTRLLAEHGSLGLIAMMILLFTPLILYFDNRNHIYLICFFVFWLLTINHAAMRLAAPAFIYALSLLKVVKNEELIVHR